MAVRGTRKNKLMKRRNAPRSVWQARLRRFGLISGALVLTLWVGAWLHFSGSHHKAGDWLEERMITASANMGFTVENILVEGRVYTDPDVLKALINVEQGEPLFAFNPSQAQALVERISWVRRAHVGRRLPDTIYIGLEERQPLALWQADKELRLIDTQGEEILTDNMERFKGLIIVMGEDAPRAAPDFFRVLEAEPLVYGQVKTAKWIEGRRWDLTMNNNVTVKLPEDDPGLALRRLALAQEEDGLLDKDIRSVDLREPDRIAVRARPGAALEYYKAGLQGGSGI